VSQALLCFQDGVKLPMLDVHSVIQMLCPSFPLSVVKNAFTPSCTLQGMHTRKYTESNLACFIVLN
jgi:hypothetical protein